MLKREYGLKIGLTRVRRLIKEMNLPTFSRKKPPIRSTKSDDQLYQNLLKRKFHAKAPNLIWVSDITYLRVGSKWCYLCVILDLFSRKVVAWKLSGKATTELVIDTFKKTYEKRGSPNALLFHSDRGCQYTSRTFRSLLEKLNIVQSFSGKGNPYDNAVAEAFFNFLKAEQTNLKTYSSFSDLHNSLFEYIEGFYNSKRPHSSLDFLPPDAFEANYFHLSCPLS